MATYIPQIQDRVEKVNPPQTDWQFEASLLQTRQSKYDAGHKKLSDMYGKILNSGLTRDQNIQAREEFFKLIDQDLKKVAGMDLSLESNVSKAQNVFSQIYENDFLVKDMVWTKQFQSEMQRANSFRDCIDPDKCGGQYWDDGVKAMNYQREEFKTMSNDESLGAGAVRYIPYNNMMEKAIDYAKEAGLSVTRDQLSGRYIMRTKNGANLVSPLTDMFNALFEKNPQLHDMYKVQAYNERKDWTYNAVRSGQYASLEEAATGYVEARAEQIVQASMVVSRGVDMDVSAIEGRLKALQRDYDKGLFNEGDSKKMAEVQNLQGMLTTAKTAQQYTDLVKNAQKNMNNQTNMNAIGAILDDARAIGFFNQDLNIAAETLAHKDMEVTMTADKFALADQAYAHDVSMENLRQKNRIELEEKKALLKGEKIDPNVGIYMMDYKQKDSLANSFNIGNYLLTTLDPQVSKQMGDNLESLDELTIRNFLRTTDNPNKDKIKAQLEAGILKHKQLKRDANEAALKAKKAGNPLSRTDFYWEEFDKEIWDAFKESSSSTEFEEYKNQIPLGIQALDKGEPIIYSYDNNPNDLYYKKDNDWYKGNSDKKTSDYVKVKTRSSIDRLESQATIFSPEL